MSDRPIKIVAVYFTEPGYDDYPFNEEEYRVAYHIMGQLLEDRNTQMIIVRGKKTYKGGLRFSGYWEFRDSAFHRHDKEIEADLLFMRGKLKVDRGINMINDPKLHALCDDKAKTYRRFTDISPMSIRVNNRRVLMAGLKKISSKLVVAKPVDGFGGAGIVIDTAEKVPKKLHDFPYLLQEFIDTSGGIPGICTGLHDFRMISVQGQIVSVFIREPRQGSYLANVSQGASIWELPVKDIPADARALFATVDKELAHFKNRVYCVDVARQKDGMWKLIELNAEPGLSAYDYDGRNDPRGKGKAEGSKRYFTSLADLLAASA